MNSTDIFERKNISPMLLFETDPFDSKDHIFELKLDGIRCLAYLDKESTDLRNKRDKDVTSLYPELSKIHKQVNKKCILDGEIIVMTNGKPDFFTLQGRSLLSDPLKISLASKRNPASFVVYDILYYDDRLVVEMPLMERKRLIEQTVTENEAISISRYIEEKGIAFFELAKQNELEGIVAKEKNSKYYIGKRSKVWQKIKVLKEDDVIIVGYVTEDSGNIKDLVLGVYDEDHNLCFRGTIYMGISAKDEKTVHDYAQKHPSKPFFDFSTSHNIVWMKPELVGVVKYMMRTKSGGMRQPVFKGLRDDKKAMDCIDHNI